MLNFYLQGSLSLQHGSSLSIVIVLYPSYLSIKQTSKQQRQKEHFFVVVPCGTRSNTNVNELFKINEPTN